MANIIAIHGMWAGGWCWTNYEKFFKEKGHNFISINLPYHGAQHSKQADAELAELGLNDYVEFVKRQAEKLDEKPIILGHSMGGLIAQMLANQDIGKAYVLLMPAAPRGVFNLSYSVLKSFLPVMTTWKFWKKPIPASFDTMVYSVTNQMPDNSQADLFEFMTPESGKAIFQTGFALIDKEKTSKIDFSKIEAPIFITSGSKDKIVPKSIVKRTAKKYPTAEYKNYENFAHWAIEEKDWEKIPQDILEWMQKNNL